VTPEEEATLVDIVRRYQRNEMPAQITMAWVYGLVVNSKLWRPEYDADPWASQ
jgi:hypothetical protein